MDVDIYHILTAVWFSTKGLRGLSFGALYYQLFENKKILLVHADRHEYVTKWDSLGASSLSLLSVKVFPLTWPSRTEEGTDIRCLHIKAVASFLHQMSRTPGGLWEPLLLLLPCSQVTQVFQHSSFSCQVHKRVWGSDRLKQHCKLVSQCINLCCCVCVEVGSDGCGDPIHDKRKTLRWQKKC